MQYFCRYLYLSLSSLVHVLWTLGLSLNVIHQENLSLQDRAQGIADTLRQLRQELQSHCPVLIRQCDEHLHWLQELADSSWREEIQGHKQGMVVEQLLEAVLYSGFLT